MKSVVDFVLLLSIFLYTTGATLQIPFSINTSSHSEPRLISLRTEEYIQTLLQKWNSSGLSVVVVRKDGTAPNGWRHQFGSYGVARADGSPVTPDTVFSISSNSKLFLALSVGLLISNKTLAEERGKELRWTTKVHELIPGWGLVDAAMDRGATIQDLLSHRTGMPQHDLSGVHREGGVSEVISTLRYLRPSAGLRERFQYSNIMYEVLSYLPQVLLNQSYESYVTTHLFKPLNMTSATFSIAEAERRGTFADTFRRDMQDMTKGKNGTLIPAIPYFARPGEEKVWVGPGGIFASARDLTTWISMLLNNGRHPYTNETIVPAEVVEHVAHGRSILEGKPSYPELSPKVYGAGQWRYAYQGHDIIEHFGGSPGFRSQVSRLPNDNLGIVVLSNEEDSGGNVIAATIYRIIDEILGLKELDWNERFEQQWVGMMARAQLLTPRPSPPKLPTHSFSILATKSFSHPTYGVLRPCLIPETINTTFPTQEHCPALLQSHAIQRVLNVTDLSIPTFIIPWKRLIATYMRLTHFNGNIFNVTVIWSNAEVREKEGYGDSRSGGDVLAGLGKHFEVEWVHGDDEGLAFKGGFWGIQGPDAEWPGGMGKDSAEVWFSKDRLPL